MKSIFNKTMLILALVNTSLASLSAQLKVESIGRVQVGTVVAFYDVNQGYYLPPSFPTSAQGDLMLNKQL